MSERQPPLGACHPSPIDLIAEALIAEGLPPEGRQVALGAAERALFAFCAARYGWGGEDVLTGAYLGWHDALRALAAAIETLGPFAVALIGEGPASEWQRALGAAQAAELWRLLEREQGIETESVE